MVNWPKRKSVAHYLMWFTKIIFTYFLVVEERQISRRRPPNIVIVADDRSRLLRFSRDLLIGCGVAQFEFAVAKSSVGHIRACWFISISISISLSFSTLQNIWDSFGSNLLIKFINCCSKILTMINLMSICVPFAILILISLRQSKNARAHPFSA